MLDLRWYLYPDGTLLPAISGGAPDEDEDEQDKEEEGALPDAESAVAPADGEKEEPKVTEEDIKRVLSSDEAKKVLDEILNDDRLIEPRVTAALEKRDADAKAQQEREEAAKPLQEAIRLARSEDEEERATALRTLGEHALRQISAEEARSPIEKEVRDEVRGEYLETVRITLDGLIEDLELSEVANTLTPEEKAPLMMANFQDVATWQRTVIKTLSDKKAALLPGSEQSKAERRQTAAARAQKTSRVPALPSGRESEDVDGSDGMSAREWMLKDK